MIHFFEVANAQTFSKVLNENPTIAPLLKKIVDSIVSPVVGLMFLLAFFYFVYSMFDLINNAADSSARETAKASVMYSVLGMALMLSVYGIVRLIAASIGTPDPYL